MPHTLGQRIKKLVNYARVKAHKLMTTHSHMKDALQPLNEETSIKAFHNNRDMVLWKASC